MSNICLWSWHGSKAVEPGTPEGVCGTEMLLEPFIITPRRSQRIIGGQDEAPEGENLNRIQEYIQNTPFSTVGKKLNIEEKSLVPSVWNKITALPFVSLFYQGWNSNHLTLREEGTLFFCAKMYKMCLNLLLWTKLNMWDKLGLTFGLKVSNCNFFPFRSEIPASVLVKTIGCQSIY